MGIAEGTVLARAKREGWMQQIQQSQSVRCNQGWETPQRATKEILDCRRVFSTSGQWRTTKEIGGNVLSSVLKIGFRAMLSCGSADTQRLAASLGLEPRQRDPESLVLPLHHEAMSEKIKTDLRCRKLA
jgi:hypothetical protein